MLPIESYMFSAKQTNFIDKAFSDVTRQCMARFDLPYDSQHPPAINVRLLDRRYGVTDARSAARYGYHLPPDSPQAVAQAQSERHRSSPLGPDELRVLSGLRSGVPVSRPSSQRAGSYRGVPIPEGGCFGEARRALDENGPGEDFTLVHQLNVESFNQSATAPSVRAAVGQWSRCMSATGYSHSDPLAALAAFDIGTAAPSQQELRTAEADVRCKSRTHLVAAWTAAEVAIQNESIRVNHAELTLIRDRMDRQLRAAGSINR